MKKALTLLAYAILLVATSALIAVVLIEFMAGCGEATYYPDGSYRINECVFLPSHPDTRV